MEEIFSEEDFTEEGWKEIKRRFRQYKKVIESDDMPFYQLIEERECLRDYKMQYEWMYEDWIYERFERDFGVICEN